MSKKPTQMERVLDYLKTYGSITRAEAMSHLRIANLPAVIDVLRHRQMVSIITTEVKGKNEYGPYTYAKYFLGETDNGNKEFSNQIPSQNLG